MICCIIFIHFKSGDKPLTFIFVNSNSNDLSLYLFILFFSFNTKQQQFMICKHFWTKSGTYQNTVWIKHMATNFDFPFQNWKTLAKWESVQTVLKTQKMFFLHVSGKTIVY